MENGNTDISLKQEGSANINFDVMKEKIKA